MEAVVFIGVQASGKSSFYQECFFHTHVRINLDMLRTHHRERRLLETRIEIGLPFVVDKTNHLRAQRTRYIVPAKTAGFRVVGYYFKSALQETIRRNETRTGKARVPKEAILGTYVRLERPRFDEGFDALYYVQMRQSSGFSVEVGLNPFIPII